RSASERTRFLARKSMPSCRRLAWKCASMCRKTESRRVLRMPDVQVNGPTPNAAQKTLLYHFCRLQMPFLNLSQASFESHLTRCFELFQAKQPAPTEPSAWPHYLINLYAVDWFLCIACLEGQTRAWEALFAARASRADCLFVDALR